LTALSGLETATAATRPTVDATMPTMASARAARSAVVAATVIGGSSLLGFGAFLLLGPLWSIGLSCSTTGALAVNTALSLAFFVQHSGMIRRQFENRMSRIVPRYLHRALYAVASGLVLWTVMLLWQPVEPILVSAGPPLRWLLRALFVAAAAGFLWGLRSLDALDGFGARPIRAHLRGASPAEPELAARGAYRWVRHPLYTAVLVMIWAAPDVTADRLLFNALWTVWVVVAVRLEERDLVADFGDAYRRYQRQVPMLLPTHRPTDMNRAGYGRSSSTTAASHSRAPGDSDHASPAQNR
jgi:methanethiol S-methyltransferase